jgi:hypothetical protein
MPCLGDLAGLSLCAFGELIFGTREDRRLSASSRDLSFVEPREVMSSRICRCWDAAQQASLR